LKLADVCPYDAEYFRREEQEYALADFHCAASTVVREQLEKNGVPREKILLVPYGANRSLFFPAPAPADKTFRIVFAGQVGLRKGLKTFLDALESAKRSDWRVDFYGAVLGEAKPDIAAYRGETPLEFHGAVPQPALAEAFRRASILVLPSLEEGFGLVVPQALNTGLPCIVSDRVGAKDLIRHHENGSVFQVENSSALLDELLFWENRRVRVEEKIPWSEPAETLISLSAKLLLKP
jgi:glycosyltransferase involved in cell wall biosynthesis